MRQSANIARILFVILLSLGVLTSVVAQSPRAANAVPDIVFVARQHLATEDVIFRNELGPAGQFGTGLAKYAPGSKLVRRNADGSLTVYNTPGLVDVQSPDVNFDATKIVFAGAKTLDPDSPDFGWRLYEINANGTGFHQLTLSDRSIVIPNANQFLNERTYKSYHDLFPAYLADGRIAFVSTRYPTRAHYDERPSTNLYIMDADGSNMRRVTTERAGLLHPTPLPDGRILLTRWWNQFNQPSEEGIFNRIDNKDVNQLLADGTVILANPDEEFNPARALLSEGYPVRDAPNTWHLMVINPDGTDFKRFAWTPRYTYALDDDSGVFDTYAAAQPALVITNTKTYIAYTSQQDSTMVHTTQQTGIRVAYPNVSMMYANTTDAVAGLTYDKAWQQDDTSGPYALHPWGLPDGRILYSQSRTDNALPRTGSYTQGSEIFDLQGSDQRYELYTMNLDGSNKTIVAVNLASISLPNADVMDAKAIVARVGWSSLSDTFTGTPNDDPRLGNIPNTFPEYSFSLKTPSNILTATIHNPNVYANASLHSPFVNNSPPPGSVSSAEVWIDANQFTGAGCYNDWPQPCNTFRQDNEVRAVLWDQVAVTSQGAFTMTVPADTMGFVVLRDANGRVVRGWNRGYISIAQGSAWARAGQTVTCVGCHMGHVSGSLDDVISEAEQGWTNVAPYAAVHASSYNIGDDPNYQPFVPSQINDRRGWVPKPNGGPGGTYQDDETGWIAAEGRSSGEWVELNWPSEITATQILLVGAPPIGGDWGGFGQPATYGDYYVESATLRVYRNGSQVGNAIAVGRIQPLTNGGTLINLPSPSRIDRLRLTVNSISGRWWWDQIAALNEIEVIGKAAEPFPLLTISRSYLPIALK